MAYHLQGSSHNHLQQWPLLLPAAHFL